MKKIYIVLVLIGLAMGCSDFTEIDPKGKNILNRVEDLDLVLNYEYGLPVSSAFQINQAVLVNDFYPFNNIPNLLTESINTLDGIHLRWDENADRAALTDADPLYTELYEVIGKVANPVLLNVDAAEGDRVLARRLKAEALVLRGWYHYLAANIYAKAYDPETAATDPGIVYALGTDVVENPNEKLSIVQVYEMILADVDSALNMDALPVQPANMRIGLPFAYAVKAMALMSMRDYEGAFIAAGQSLELNDAIDNYNDFIEPESTMGTGLLEFTHPRFALQEELFQTPVSIATAVLSSEMWDAFEEGHVVGEYLMTDVKMFGMPMIASPFCGIPVAALYSNAVYYSPLGLTTVDMYLLRAECLIREGNLLDAMGILNYIRENRIRPEVYVPRTASSATEAIALLKSISRTENFATLKNFINQKRWNTEEAYQETLHKTITYDANGESHEFTATLSPDSPLWIFPFPQNATNYNPNLTQNY